MADNVMCKCKGVYIKTGKTAGGCIYTGQKVCSQILYRQCVEETEKKPLNSSFTDGCGEETIGSRCEKSGALEKMQSTFRNSGWLMASSMLGYA